MHPTDLAFLKRDLSRISQEGSALVEVEAILRRGLALTEKGDEALAALDSLLARLEATERELEETSKHVETLSQAYEAAEETAHLNFTHAASGDVAELLLLRRLEAVTRERDHYRSNADWTAQENRINGLVARAEAAEAERDGLLAALERYWAGDDDALLETRGWAARTEEPR